MFTKKFVKRNFTFKFHVKVWSCNRHFSFELTLQFMKLDLVIGPATVTEALGEMQDTIECAARHLDNANAIF